MFNSNSNEPSKTIKTSPIVPSIGKIGDKSGMDRFKNLVTSFTHQPKPKRRITDGILVFDEEMSKMYAKSNKTQMEMITVVVILLFR